MMQFLIELLNPNLLGLVMISGLAIFIFYFDLMFESLGSGIRSLFGDEVDQDRGGKSSTSGIESANDHPPDKSNP